MIPGNFERFPDLHPAFDPQAAVVEANRCLYCFDAPCTAACPTHIDVPRFIKKISTGNLRGSAQTAQLLEATREHGLLVGKGGLYGNVIRVTPPMNIGRTDVDNFIELLDKSLTAVTAAAVGSAR